MRTDPEIKKVPTNYDELQKAEEEEEEVASSISTRY